MSDEATTRPTGSALTREELLNALRALSDKLGEQGVTGELCLFGGFRNFRTCDLLCR
jgi:hypothetical protein